MAQSTTHIGLPAGAVILDQADNAPVVSYVVTANGTDSLYTLNLSTGATTFVASAPSDDSHNNFFDTGHGIASGILSANGHFIFYSAGALPGGLSPGNDATHLFVKDLQSNAPPTDITPVVTSF